MQPPRFRIHCPIPRYCPCQRALNLKFALNSHDVYTALGAVYFIDIDLKYSRLKLLFILW